MIITIAKYYIISIIIYYSYLFITYNKINYKIFFYFIKNITRKEIININTRKIDFIIIFENYIYTIKKIFLFKNLENITSLAYINAMLNSFSQYNFKELNSKLFWYELCKKNKINHPKLYYIKNKNNTIKKINIPDSDKFYILKPINGFQGYGIIKIKGSKIPDYLSCNKYNNFIIQEFLKDNLTNHLCRHFRIITIFNGDIFILYKFVNDKKIVSNSHQNGIVNFISEETFSEFSELEKNLLNEMKNKLSSIHKNQFENLISIGWDLMISNNKIYLLEGNCWNHGVINNATPKEKIEEYYNYSNNFLKKLYN